MTQLSTALLHMQTNSKFHQAYQTGTASKDTYWEYTLEDSLDLIAKISRVAALIYRHTFHPSDVNVDRILATDSSLDYSANFCRWLGFDDAEFDELMRLYIVIHSDHEGGNASAHTTHLVASTLADPYLSYASGLCALAGPLHGLANQEVLKWIMNLKAKFDAEGKEVNEETITQFAWDTLNNKQVIPGFGHAVLRQTDPRYTCQRDFALRNSAHTSPLFSIVDNCFKVMPKVLTEHGKTANPYPNVDAHSGMLLTHYGLHEMEYYTVLFGVSRAFGALTQVVWDRALGLPLERPKSMTLDSIEKFCNGN
jgi:citrate synthase